ETQCREAPFWYHCEDRFRFFSGGRQPRKVNAFAKHIAARECPDQIRCGRRTQRCAAINRLPGLTRRWLADSRICRLKYWICKDCNSSIGIGSQRGFMPDHSECGCRRQIHNLVLNNERGKG